jgi:NAD(P)-dependent dehydrogenase (short-subunit alcohol dehydrogenase family)
MVGPARSAPLDFVGRVAVVTGRGRGLGRAHCLELAGRGAAVVDNDIAGEHADATVADIRAAGGTAVASYDTVVTPEGAAAITAAAVDNFGGLDIVVNAGSMHNGYFSDQTPSMLDEMLDVHVRGTFFVSHAAWQVLAAQRYGRIVMTSSAGGLLPCRAKRTTPPPRPGCTG